MATQKPDLTRVWANGAPPANVVDPDTTTPGKVNAGWQAEVPPFEHFNFLQKWFTQGLAYNNEQGINEWDTDTLYPVDGITKGSNGFIYVSQIEQNGNDPVSDDGTNWKVFITPDKYSGAVNVITFGAVLDGVTDDSSAVISAIATGKKVYFPSGICRILATVSNSDTILGMLDNFSADGEILIELDAGVHNLTQQIVCRSSDLSKVTILGASPTLMNTTGQYHSGSAKNWLVTTAVDNAATIEIGDFITYDPLTGTDNFYGAAGLWKVTNKVGNNITFKSTNHSATLQGGTTSTANLRVYKTVVKFIGSDGFRFEVSQPLARFDQVIVEGDWDVAAVTGTTGTHGIITSSPVVTPGGDSNETYNSQGIVTLGPSFGVYGFGEQGIALSGRTAGVMNFVYSCANRKRGIYAEASSVRGKFMNCSGNGEDGFISDTVGYLQCAFSKAVGNGLNGFWSTNNSLVACATSVSASNITNGFEARGLTRMASDLCEAYENGGAGFSASDGGMIDADNAIADGNTGDGYVAVSGGIIDADNSTSTNNLEGYDSQLGSNIRAGGSTASGNAGGDYKPKANGLMLGSSGDIYPSDQEFGSVQNFTTDRAHNVEKTISSLGNVTYSIDGVKIIELKSGVQHVLYNPANNHTMEHTVSSIGDGFIGLDGTVNIVIKNGQEFKPNTDDVVILGSATNRWSTVFAGTGTINTSDSRLKTEPKSLLQAEISAAKDLSKEIKSYKWLNAIENKGDDARLHIGLTVQRAIEIMESHSLNPMLYGFICYDKWDDKTAELDGEGNVLTEAVEAGDRYGFRYSELSMFILAGLNARLEDAGI